MPKVPDDLLPSVNGMLKIKNMRNIPLFCLCFVLSLKDVVCESEYEIKTGIYPYMAVIYYPDVTIVGPSGTRFSRSAVVIKQDWLISSSLETNETQLAFPQKTLIARAGAVAIDSNFTVNEDEGEQEREIIQIVRPTNFTVSQWWMNDVTLLKTLMPFMMTPTVKSTTLSVKNNYKMDKTCSILVFAKKYPNSTDDKLLIKLAVELLPTTNENCGVHFRNETMICASNSEENNNIVYEPEFCRSNGGGPLICDNDVIGLQTYIGDSCKPPYLYQLLSAWDDFITCGIEEKYRIREYASICTSIDKDDDIPFGANDIMTIPTVKTTKDTAYQSTEESNDEERLILPDSSVAEVMTVNENETPTPTTTSTTEITTTIKETTPTSTENEEKTTRATEETETSWPKEKLVGYRKQLDEAENSENVDRSANVEAQHHEAKKKGRSAAESYVTDKMGLIHSLLFTVLFFIYLI